VHHAPAILGPERAPNPRGDQDLLAELMRAANRRYLDFLSALDDPSEGDRQLARISRPVHDQNRSYRGINFFEGRDLRLLLAIARGEHRIRGFQVRDLCRHLAELSGPQISRLVKRLRMHRLIKKDRNTYRYHHTRLGERVIAAGLQLREYCIVPALAAARS
jgi:DNA-binding MarR family transcriptional regulator